MLLTTGFVLGLLSSFSAVTACSDHDDDHAHVHARRASLGPVPPTPKTPLEWGDINIIHTTDTHGWLLGHQHKSWPEPNYSGTLGDFASFVKGMKDLAKKYDKDLLLVDSGDIHDGTGLTDGGPAGSVDAHEVLKYFKELEYNVMTVGNHEMYNYSVALDMHANFAVPPAPDRRYVSSNAIITLQGGSNGAAVNTTVGEPYAKFSTLKGRNVTALGVLFTNFKTDKNLYHQNIADMINEDWFHTVIKDEPDLFLLAGHMPLATNDDEWDKIVKAIRDVHPYTPIAIMGGHSHIRDCRLPDEYSMALQSGRYMDTVGWMSIKLGSEEGKYRPSFTRRYLDPNRVTYEYHTQKNETEFVTMQGQQVDQGLNALADNYDLNHKFGMAKRDYTLTQDNATSEGSLYHLYVNEAMPYVLKNNRSNPTINIINGGFLRFDVYSGDFTKNDQYAAANYADFFRAVYDVPFGYAVKVLSRLNTPSPALARRSADREGVDEVYNRWLEEQSTSYVREEGVEEDSVLGYVTSDRCGPPGSGDDVKHTPMKYFKTPSYLGSTPSNISGNETLVDIIFLDFIGTKVIDALNKIQTVKVYKSTDLHDYTKILSNEVLGLYATDKWN